MIFIVDGYNVLKKSSVLISERERFAFIKRISRYCEGKGKRAILVFDGGDSFYPSRYMQRHVEVIYSGTRQIADDVIKDLLVRPMRDEALLVSEDHELVALARQQGIVQMTPHAFEHLLRLNQEVGSVAPRLRADAPLIKMSDEENTELDLLMEEACEHMVNKKEDLEARTKREGSAEQPSRIEKRLNKIIKKL